MGLFTRKKKENAQENRPVPQHIAVIMDGNGRWAKKRGLPRKAGHKVGAETFRTIATYCKDIGVKYFTVYAFSTENWKRPQDEVDALMNLFRAYLKELSKNPPTAGGLFKKSSASPVASYIQELEQRCFICERMEDSFHRYIDTIFYLWKKDEDFRSAMADCKGFCTYHYGLLYQTGADKLDKQQYSAFLDCLNRVYFAGMERVNDDIEWFINKYDYRYVNEPWKNAKDAIPRGILKANHIYMDGE